TLSASFGGTSYNFTVSYGANTVVLTVPGPTATPTAAGTPAATPTATPIPTMTSTPAASATSVPPAATATPTAVPSSGGGGPAPAPPAPAGQNAGSSAGTPANGFGFIVGNGTAPLSSPNVVASSASVPWATGGDIVAGSVGLSVPPQPGLPGNMS